MHKLLILLCSVALGFTVRSQTLFTYGAQKVDKKEFERAFSKNNPSNELKKESIQEYLDLFINFKLKVQAARDLKLDTLSNQKADLLNFRRQIESGFMTEEKTINALVKEAFERSQKDLHIAHIFIPFDPGFISNPAVNYMANKQADTSKAYQAIQKAFDELKAGADFSAVARKYSLDPAVNANKGDIGFITVFSLPYELENIAYGLPVGRFSVPYRSMSGYHIIKKIEERPAFGKMKAAQILLTFTPNSGPEEKQQLKRLADSLYGALQKGSAFDALARQFSTDRTGYLTGGVMPDFGIGRYEREFEDAAFGLQHNGDISRPIETAFGIHIIKRLGRVPASLDPSQAKALFRDEVMQDSRMQVANHLFDLEVLKLIEYRKAPLDEKALWQATDSFILRNSVVPVKNINANTILFSFAKLNKKAADWFPYARTIKTTSPEFAKLPFRELLNKFAIETGREYYRNHLEDYNAEFRAQLNEFKEGNLLFEVMERQVWSKAAADSSGLRAFYNRNRDKYQWGPSADAIFFTTSNRETAIDVRKNIKGIAEHWRMQSDLSNGKVIADSGRFELSQIPLAKNQEMNAGSMSPLIVNDQDSTATFVYVIKTYADSARRSFEEARGLVINDYQTELEKKWIAILKRKYPVKMNQAVFQSLIHK